MTDTQGQETLSEFNVRADSAALALKEQLGQELSAMTGQQVVLPPSPVAVGADGQPAGQLPAEGTYARDQIAQQQQAAAERAAQQAAMQQYNPPNEPPPAPPRPPPQEPQEQLSHRVQERISSLIEQLRQKDQDFQTLQQQNTSTATAVEELQSQLTASRNQMEGLLEQNMENMDPETRLRVLSDARIKQAVAESEKRVLQAVGPRLEALQVRNDQLEKVRVSGVYEGYDPAVHDGLIDEFRRGNPNCSIEQAFRAVAHPDEIGVPGVGRANAPPPTVPPGSGAPSPRYLPETSGPTDPVEQMRVDANKAAELARSTDPADQKAATALWHKNIADRLGMQIPGVTS
jgi:hypothetical protein